MEIIIAYWNSGTNLTLGVIGNSFGNDIVLVSFINQTISVLEHKKS